MVVKYEQTLYRRRSGLSNKLDRLALLRQSNVNFIPIGGDGQTIRTSPLLEDSALNWRERFLEAAVIYLTNPLCFSAQNLINDEIADARIIVQEKQSNGDWTEHDNNNLADWIDHPNSSMDIKEFMRAYSTHFHTFGCVYSFMFQQGDYLPNGKINAEKNCFDIIFPGRIAEDTVSNPHGIDWYYQPLGIEQVFQLHKEALFIDVLYNPVAHSLGVSLPNNPLGRIFRIHNLYMQSIERYFSRGAMARYVLTRVVDLQKDANAMSITDVEIEQAVQRLYAKVGSGGERENGVLGLRGDWKLQKLGSDLKDLMDKDLLHQCDVAVGAVYKVPPSLFWAGMESGGGRATRQQDSIDFYNNKIKPFRERILDRLSYFLVPLFIKGKTSKQFRLYADVSESGLAQYAITKQYRMYERWWQLRAIDRGTFLKWINEDKLAASLSKEQQKEYYSGSNDSQGMNVAAGDAGQGVEGDAIGGGGGGTAQPD